MENMNLKVRGFFDRLNVREDMMKIVVVHKC